MLVFMLALPPCRAFPSDRCFKVVWDDASADCDALHSAMAFPKIFLLKSSPLTPRSMALLARLLYSMPGSQSILLAPLYLLAAEART
jgi:hypothetical protein